MQVEKLKDQEVDDRRGRIELQARETQGNRDILSQKYKAVKLSASELINVNEGNAYGFMHEECPQKCHF